MISRAFMLLSLFKFDKSFIFFITLYCFGKMYYGRYRLRHSKCVIIRRLINGNLYMGLLIESMGLLVESMGQLIKFMGL